MEARRCHTLLASRHFEMGRAQASPCCSTSAPSTLTQNQSQTFQSWMCPPSNRRSKRGTSELKSSALAGKRISRRKRTAGELVLAVVLVEEHQGQIFVLPNG